MNKRCNTLEGTNTNIQKDLKRAEELNERLNQQFSSTNTLKRDDRIVEVNKMRDEINHYKSEILKLNNKMLEYQELESAYNSDKHAYMSTVD